MPVYLAPGVYVVEVPSAQQPITPVGTNTVGFIGIVPDRITYPVPNENYNPELAMDALLPPEERAKKNKERTELFDDKIKGLDDNLKDAQARLEKAKNELTAKPDAAPPEKKKLETQRDTANADIKKFTQQLQKAKADRDKVIKPPDPDDPSLKPYLLSGQDVVDSKGNNKGKVPEFEVNVPPGDAKLCVNFTEYTDRFGSFSADDPAKDPGKARHPGHRALTHAVYGFFQNGGTRCFVARVKPSPGEPETANSADVDKALADFESIDEIAIVAAPGLEGKGIWNLIVAHCNKMEDRFAILDSPADVESGGELDVTLLNYNNPDPVLPETSKNAAFYFPHIEVIDPAKQLQDQDPARKIPVKHRGKVYVPPSGHVAGIYARVDEQRGVHKAPGNEPVVGALDVKYYIGKRKQELLNPQGVNCIRNLNGNIRVYGARTIGGDKNVEWKYINVRRVFLFLRESIDEGTQWVVFEPNDPSLWGKIRRNVSAFLTIVWRDGALFGTTPQEAFYVKCDEETNPPEVRDLGQVVTEIGVAIVRPAEFVIFKVTQWAGPRGTTI